MQHWLTKFRNATVGVIDGIRGQSSFAVHLPVTLLVIALAVWLQMSLIEWCVLLLCIAVVLSAELFNSAIERLAKQITQDHSEHLRVSLNIAAGAVLVPAILAVVIGVLLFGGKLLAISF